jgi:hypothetical protein
MAGKKGFWVWLWRLLSGKRRVENEHIAQAREELQGPGFYELHCEPLGPNPCAVCKEMGCPIADQG